MWSWRTLAKKRVSCGGPVAGGRPEGRAPRSPAIAWPTTTCSCAIWGEVADSAEEALPVGERLREGVIAARAALVLGLIRHFAGDLETRSQRSAGVSRRRGRSTHVVQRGSACATCTSAAGRPSSSPSSAVSRRHPSRRRRRSDRAESVLNIFSMTFARLSIARVHLLRGDFERALRHLESGFDLVETYDIGLVRRLFIVGCRRLCRGWPARVGHPLVVGGPRSGRSPTLLARGRSWPPGVSRMRPPPPRRLSPPPAGSVSRLRRPSPCWSSPRPCRGGTVRSNRPDRTARRRSASRRR